MKKSLTILLFVFSLSISNIFAQDFGAVGTEWHYNENGGGAAPGEEYVHLKSEKDTIIEGKPTHKITWTYYQHNKKIRYEDPLFVYEENDTVYHWSFKRNKFLKTYIFNVNLGDTLILDVPDMYNTKDSTYRFIVSKIDSVEIDSKFLKTYYLTGLDGFEFFSNRIVYERIGSIDWFFPRGPIFPEIGGPLRCYRDNEIDTNFGQVPCDYIRYSSVEDINNKRIKIFPNPAKSSMMISGIETEFKASIYNILGEKVLEFESINSNEIIDISVLNKGIYFIKIKTFQNENFVEKIVIE